MPYWVRQPQLQTKKQIEPTTYLRLYIGMIIFYSVQFLSKTNNQTEIFFKKKYRNQTETSSNRLVSVWFFRTKIGSNRFGSVFSGLA